MGQLFYEKAVDSFPELAEEVRLLDLDSGIRTFGEHGKKRCLVFVTRSPHDTYTLMVYENKRDGTPGRRLLVKEFRTERELVGFMRGLVSRPVKAFVY